MDQVAISAERTQSGAASAQRLRDTATVQRRPHTTAKAAGARIAMGIATVVLASGWLQIAVRLRNF